ncbi:MAG: AmmeMemoRadiSam system protein B [Chloroflexi bacterium]|nr:AmmeMemoRadiSam system protein B [Chloroflexota bacterium]
MTEHARPAAVAGSFYPGDAKRLVELVGALRAAAGEPPTLPGPLLGLLVPHAGLVYSGVVAAAAWGLLADDPPATVVILGTDHHGIGPGIAAWDRGPWATPSGPVETDEALAAVIAGLGRPFRADRNAHRDEHSIEVQLPLLLQIAPATRIVALATATGTGPEAAAAGELLGHFLAARRAAGERVILAASSDMAHYPVAADAERVTEALLPAILARDPGRLAREEASLRRAGIPGLSCGMCGIEPAVVGLAALAAMGATGGTALAAATSADAGGPPGRTVGYLSVAFTA